jgi:hypothetical protein
MLATLGAPPSPHNLHSYGAFELALGWNCGAEDHEPERVCREKTSGCTIQNSISPLVLKFQFMLLKYMATGNLLFAFVVS